MESKDMFLRLYSDGVGITETGWQFIVSEVSKFEHAVSERFNLPSDVEVLPRDYVNATSIRCSIERQLSDGILKGKETKQNET